ncbi:MAG: hypothetical protein LH480_00230 [Rubrivivax sp.]|nr:hypothetical protein [Rubrivivax sp.]
MASERLYTACIGSCIGSCVGLVLLALHAGAAAQPVPGAVSGIYTCIDSTGRRWTADRPIPECVHKEQQVLNRDGSVRAVVPPTLTAEERAVKDARDRAAADARVAQADAVRRDRNLVVRYPDEATHQRAREASADTVRLAIKATEERLRELEAERKPLRDEAEFYQGRPMPAKLKAAMDANDASVQAQRASSANQEAELVRINRIYDNELQRLRRLWAGAQPGSLGPMPAAPALAPVRPSKVSMRPAVPAAAAAPAQR